MKRPTLKQVGQDLGISTATEYLGEYFTPCKKEDAVHTTISEAHKLMRFVDFIENLNEHKIQYAYKAWQESDCIFFQLKTSNGEYKFNIPVLNYKSGKENWNLAEYVYSILK